MSPFWTVSKTTNNARHYAGLLFDSSEYLVYSFYYTTKSPRFIRIKQEWWGGIDLDGRLSRLAIKSKILRRGYKEIDIQRFNNQCPEFDSALEEYLIVRKLRYGV